MQYVISHADFLLSVFENFTAEERPPEWMWPFDDLMGDELDKISKERLTKFDSKAGQEDDSDLPKNELLQFG